VRLYFKLSLEIEMEKRKSDIDLADLLLNGFTGSEEMSLPMPRFGKVSLKDQQAKPLPKIGINAPNKSELSWADEDYLGIRVFIVEEEGSKGPEICAYVEGIRTELLGKAVSVALHADKGYGSERLTIQLNEPTEDKRGCRGKGSFGATAEVRKQLGENVVLDVFLLEWAKQETQE